MEPGVPRREYAALMQALAGRSLRELGREVTRGRRGSRRDVRGGRGRVPDRSGAAGADRRGMERARGRAHPEGPRARRASSATSMALGGSSPRASCPATWSRARPTTSRRSRGSAPVRPVAIAGLDVVRDHEGRFRVLEDNVRTPSGIAYAVAARELMRGAAARTGRGPARDRRRLRAAGRRAARGRPGGPAARPARRGPQRRAGEHGVVGALRDRGAAAGAARRARRPRRRRRRALRAGRRAPAARRRRLPAHRRGPPDRADGRPTSVGSVLHEPWRAGHARAGQRASAPASPTTSSPTPTSRRWSASTSGEEPMRALRAHLRPLRPRGPARRCSGASTSWSSSRATAAAATAILVGPARGPTAIARRRAARAAQRPRGVCRPGDGPPLAPPDRGRRPPGTAARRPARVRLPGRRARARRWPAG